MYLYCYCLWNCITEEHDKDCIYYKENIMKEKWIRYSRDKVSKKYKEVKKDIYSFYVKKVIEESDSYYIIIGACADSYEAVPKDEYEEVDVIVSGSCKMGDMY